MLRSDRCECRVECRGATAICPVGDGPSASPSSPSRKMRPRAGCQVFRLQLELPHARSVMLRWRAVPNETRAECTQECTYFDFMFIQKRVIADTVHCAVASAVSRISEVAVLAARPSACSTSAITTSLAHAHPCTSPVPDSLYVARAPLARRPAVQ